MCECFERHENRQFIKRMHDDDSEMVLMQVETNQTKMFIPSEY